MTEPHISHQRLRFINMFVIATSWSRACSSTLGEEASWLAAKSVRTCRWRVTERCSRGWKHREVEGLSQSSALLQLRDSACLLMWKHLILEGIKRPQKESRKRERFQSRNIFTSFRGSSSVRCGFRAKIRTGLRGNVSEGTVGEWIQSMKFLSSTRQWWRRQYKCVSVCAGLCMFVSRSAEQKHCCASALAATSHWNSPHTPACLQLAAGREGGWEKTRGEWWRRAMLLGARGNRPKITLCSHYIRRPRLMKTSCRLDCVW